MNKFRKESLFDPEEIDELLRNYINNNTNERPSTKDDKVGQLACECGSEKVVGSNARHSFWCPKAKI